MVMFICRGKRSRLQVALLIYGPNITFRSLDGGLGMSRLGLLRSCSLFLVSSFLNKSPLTLVGPTLRRWMPWWGVSPRAPGATPT